MGSMASVESSVLGSKGVTYHRCPGTSFLGQVCMTYELKFAFAIGSRLIHSDSHRRLLSRASAIVAFIPVLGALPA